MSIYRKIWPGRVLKFQQQTNERDKIWQKKQIND